LVKTWNFAVRSHLAETGYGRCRALQKKRQTLKDAGDWAGLTSFPRSSSAVRIRNRLQVDGKARGYWRQFGICRNQFRQMASERQNSRFDQGKLVILAICGKAPKRFE